MIRFLTWFVAHRHRGAGCLCWLLILVAGCSLAGGIDHLVEFDDSGIWKRSNQTALINILIAGEVAGALWEGGDTRLGKTFWQSIDSSAIGALSSEALKHIFTRSRPDQSPDPNLWFQGHGHYSFPSGEVTAVTAIVSPFVFEYAHADAPDAATAIRWRRPPAAAGRRWRSPRSRRAEIAYRA